VGLHSVVTASRACFGLVYWHGCGWTVQGVGWCRRCTAVGCERGGAGKGAGGGGGWCGGRGVSSQTRRHNQGFLGSFRARLRRLLPSGCGRCSGGVELTLPRCRHVFTQTPTRPLLVVDAFSLRRQRLLSQTPTCLLSVVNLSPLWCRAAVGYGRARLQATVRALVVWALVVFAQT